MLFNCVARVRSVPGSRPRLAGDKPRVTRGCRRLDEDSAPSTGQGPATRPPPVSTLQPQAINLASEVRRILLDRSLWGTNNEWMSDSSEAHQPPATGLCPFTRLAVVLWKTATFWIFPGETCGGSPPHRAAARPQARQQATGTHDLVFYPSTSTSTSRAQAAGHWSSRLSPRQQQRTCLRVPLCGRV